MAVCNFTVGRAKGGKERDGLRKGIPCADSHACNEANYPGVDAGRDRKGAEQNKENGGDKRLGNDKKPDEVNDRCV